MGATHSRKKKSSSKSIRKEGDELREEEQSEGRRRFSLFRKSRFHERCVEVENKADKAANVSDYKYNIVNNEVNNHNFLEYKLQAIKKKYGSNSTEKITEKNYPEQFNPFAIEEEYSSILNPFDEDDDDEEEYSSILNPFDEDDDDEDENPLENIDNITNNSEMHSIENFNHEDIVEDKETSESIKVNSTAKNPLMAIYHEINDSDDEDKIEVVETCESVKVDSTPRSPLMATYEENNESGVKVFHKNEDDFVDFYNSESKTEKINISEKETHSVLEKEKQTKMMIKEDNSTEIVSNKEEITSNKTPVSDTASFSEINKFNQKETMENNLKTTSSDTDKDNLQTSSSRVSSLEKVSSIQALEEVDNFISSNFASKIEDKETPENRNNFNPENPFITIDVKTCDPKINAVEIDYNEKCNTLCEFENPVNEKANIKKNITPKNDSPSKNINSCNVPPATKKKSFKKYKAPAPPVFPTLPLKLESHKGNENASRIQNLKQSSNYQKNLIIPTSLKQEESENRYRISRPAPPVPESLKPARATADIAPKSMKIVPTNECGRKVRRKSILDLFKVKKKKKKVMDMF